MYKGTEKIILQAILGAKCAKLTAYHIQDTNIISLKFIQMIGGVVIIPTV